MSQEKQRYFGGIEGGATATKIVLLDAQGKFVSDASGPSTNHWLVGLDVCLERINALVTEAKQKAGIDPSQQLESLGMSLSGGDSLEARDNIRRGMLSQYPAASRDYEVCCDTVGSLATACENGGVVLISGTGSNCELINPDGTTTRCGGWGHMMGDEGSAFWISRYCVKQMYDKEDNLDPCTHDVSVVKRAMEKHFGTSDKMAMLEHLYTKFDKSFFAGLCKELATGASVDKDPLCVEAFTAAGRALGRHIVALAQRIDKTLLASSEGLTVVCVGSVFKSWPLLQPGFVAGLSSAKPYLSAVTLKDLQKPATYGAAYLGAKRTGYRLPLDFDANANTFFTHKL